MPHHSNPPIRARRLAAALGLAGALAAAGAPAGAQRSAPRGTIKGHVKLLGKLPGNPIIRMGMDPMCARINAGRRVIQETVAAAIDGSLANVFVRLEGSFPPAPPPKQPVVLDQSGCIYHPRVLGAQVGQVLQVRNSDDLIHNVHSLSATGNSFNVSEPKAGMVQSFTLRHEEVMLRIKCDIHSWMVAYVGVVPHPYFAVTNQAGAFEIDNVPPGTYMITAWQERYGPQTQKVQVKAGATATVEFTYTSTEKSPA